MSEELGGMPSRRSPYNMGIKEFKRLLKENKNLSRSDKSKAVRLYKERVQDRLKELREYAEQRLQQEQETGVHLEGE